MENKITELVFILDESDEMVDCRNFIECFNSMIEKQKQVGGKVFVSTVFASLGYRVMHDRKILDEISPIAQIDYRPCYRLWSLAEIMVAVIDRINNNQKNIAKKDIPNQTIFVVIDGGNNSYEKPDILNEKIRQCKEEKGWEFLFLAANIDAVKTADFIGICANRASSYAKHNTSHVFNVVSDAICQYRKTGKIADDWAKNIDAEPWKSWTRDSEDLDDSDDLLYVFDDLEDSEEREEPEEPKEPEEPEDDLFKDADLIDEGERDCNGHGEAGSPEADKIIAADQNVDGYSDDPTDEGAEKGCLSDEYIKAKEKIYDNLCKKIEKAEDLKTLYDYGIVYFDDLKHGTHDGCCEFDSRHYGYRSYVDYYDKYDSYILARLFSTVVKCILNKSFSTNTQLEHCDDLTSPWLVNMMSKMRDCECIYHYSDVEIAPPDYSGNKHFLGLLCKPQKHFYDKGLKEFLEIVGTFNKNYEEVTKNLQLNLSCIIRVSNTFNEFMTIYVDYLNSL